MRSIWSWAQFQVQCLMQPCWIPESACQPPCQRSGKSLQSDICAAAHINVATFWSVVLQNQLCQSLLSNGSRRKAIHTLCFSFSCCFSTDRLGVGLAKGFFFTSRRPAVSGSPRRMLALACTSWSNVCKSLNTPPLEIINGELETNDVHKDRKGAHYI